MPKLLQFENPQQRKIIGQRDKGNLQARGRLAHQPCEVEASHGDVAVIRFVAPIRPCFVDAINRLIRPDSQIAVSSHPRVNDLFYWPCLPLIEAQPHRQDLASVKLVRPHSGNAFTIRIREKNPGAVVRWTSAVADDAGCANRLK